MNSLTRKTSLKISNHNSQIDWANVWVYEYNGKVYFEIELLGPGNSNVFPRNAINVSVELSQSLNETTFTIAGDNVVSTSSRKGLSTAKLQSTGDSSTIVFWIEDANTQIALNDIFSISLGKGGGSKEVPEAPISVDDYFAGTEDTILYLDVLDNDVSREEELLSIKSISFMPSKGHAKLVDLDGNGLYDRIVYTPHPDSAGNDKLVYSVVNQHGDENYAHVEININPVSDEPVTSVTKKKISNYEYIIQVLALPSDTDGSETIKSITYSDIADERYDLTLLSTEINEAGAMINRYRLDFSDDLRFFDWFDARLDFDIKVVDSAGNTSTSSATQIETFVPFRILLFSDGTTSSVTTFDDFAFHSYDQSMWKSGDSQGIDMEYYFSIFDIGTGLVHVDKALYEFKSQFDARIGLVPWLSVSSGDVDATSIFDISFSNKYNPLNDQLTITPSAQLKDASFATTFAQGNAGLDLYYDVGGFVQFDPFDLEKDPTKNWVNWFFDKQGSINLLKFGSDSLASQFKVPGLPLSLSLDWPLLGINSGPYVFSENSNSRLPPELIGVSGGYGFTQGEGISNNIINFNLDADELLVKALNYVGIPVPQALFNGEWKSLSYQTLDMDIGFGVNLTQGFEMIYKGLEGIVQFTEASDEIQSTFGFSSGTPLVIDNASSLFDADRDGIIHYDAFAEPSSTLKSLTGMGLNLYAGATGPGFAYKDNYFGYSTLFYADTTVASLPLFNNLFEYEYEPTFLGPVSAFV